MFHTPGKKTTQKNLPLPTGFMEIVATVDIINPSKYEHLIQQIKQTCCLDPARFDGILATLIAQLANYYQRLPETAHSYYALPGGLFEHALNRTEAALQLAQHYFLQERQGVLTEQQKLWLYALASASLLRGIGKLPTEYLVALHDGSSQTNKYWNPLIESLVATGRAYQYKLKKTAEKTLRCRLTLLLARTLMPTAGFAWIADDQNVLTTWLALLDEDEEGAGTLGAILEYADAIAIQRYLSDFHHRMSGPGRHGGGDGGGGSGPLGRPIRMGTFSDNTPLTVADKEHLIGAEFIKWLTAALENKKIMINKAPLMAVPGGLIMLPEMFQLFVREHPEYKNAQAVEKGFLSWGLHRMRQDGRIIFSQYAIALPAKVSVYQTNKHETLSAVDCLHQMRSLNKTKSLHQTDMPRVLSPHGEWISVENAPHHLKSGATHRG